MGDGPVFADRSEAFMPQHLVLFFWWASLVGYCLSLRTCSVAHSTKSTSSRSLVARPDSVDRGTDRTRGPWTSIRRKLGPSDSGVGRRMVPPCDEFPVTRRKSSSTIGPGSSRTQVPVLQTILFIVDLTPRVHFFLLFL